MHIIQEDEASTSQTLYKAFDIVKAVSKAENGFRHRQKATDCLLAPLSLKDSMYDKLREHQNGILFQRLQKHGGASAPTERER